jgi:hypothetical protein
MADGGARRETRHHYVVEVRRLIKGGVAVRCFEVEGRARARAREIRVADGYRRFTSEEIP